MNCKNCGAPLEDDAGFCAYCGARKIDERISTKFLFQEILDKVLSVDNKLLKTFIHLFTKPEQVINGYISGIRKRYYNPFSYLLISITISGIYFYFIRDIMIDTFSSPDSQNPFNQTDFMTNLMDYMTDYQAFFTVLNIPIYGFISYLVFYNRNKYNFYEHLVIYLYAASHTIIFSFIIVTPFYFISANLTAITSVSMSVLTLVYFSYVLIRLFKLNFWQFIVKGSFFMIVSTACFMFLGLLMNVAMMISLGPQEYLKQFDPNYTNKSKDSLKQKSIDSLQKTKKLDSIKKEPTDSIKEISYYEASSKLNCLS